MTLLLSGAVIALISIAVYAGVAIGTFGYYDCNDYYYVSYNSVVTGSNFAWATTDVFSQDLTVNFPAGYVGIQPYLCDAQTKKAVISAAMTYNSRETNTFSKDSLTYYTSKGTFYSQGITRGYHPSDQNAIYYPYHQFSTFASPFQSVPST